MITERRRSLRTMLRRADCRAAGTGTVCRGIAGAEGRDGHLCLARRARPGPRPLRDGTRHALVRRPARRIGHFPRWWFAKAGQWHLTRTGSERAHYWRHPDGVPRLGAVTFYGRTGPQVLHAGIPLIGVTPPPSTRPSSSTSRTTTCTDVPLSRGPDHAPKGAAAVRPCRGAVGVELRHVARTSAAADEDLPRRCVAREHAA